MSALSIRALGRGLALSPSSLRSHFVLNHPLSLSRRATTAIETAPAPVVAAVAEPAAVTSTLWTKLVAFCGGIAVGGAYFLYLNYTGEFSKGGSEFSHGSGVESSHVRAETVAAANMISQQRLAALEHEVATLRTEIEARL
jgi:hypothetical protein